LMTFGHVPGPLRKLLQDRFGNWDAVEKGVKDALDAKRSGSEAALDPQKEAQAIQDHARQKVGDENTPLRAAPTYHGIQNLVEKMPGEPDLRDPAGQLANLESHKASGDALRHLSALNRVVDRLHRGLPGIAENPIEGITRVWAGHQRVIDRVFN